MHHAQSVALILNIHTGITLPQFHVQFDNAFTTVRDRSTLPRIYWQERCWFVEQNSPIDTTQVLIPKGVPLQLTPPPTVELVTTPEAASLQHMPATLDTRSDGAQGSTNATSNTQPGNVRRSACERHPVQRLIEALPAQVQDEKSGYIEELFAYTAWTIADTDSTNPRVAFKVSIDPILCIGTML
jgi:hypothetical protein